MLPSAPQITLPRRPQPAVRPSFPYLASIAPVVVSMAIWLVTQSTFALLFAALGPVVAVGSLVDARLQLRRVTRREGSRYSADLAAAEDALHAAHETERAALLRASPTPRDLLRAPTRSTPPGLECGDDDQPTGESLSGTHAGELWRANAEGAAHLRVGLGEIRSAVELRGDAEPGAEPDPRLEVLRASATRLQRVPIRVDAALGIGLRGGRVQTEAAIRGLGLQLAMRLPPDRYGIDARGTVATADWLRALPHPREPGAPGQGPSAIIFRALDPSAVGAANFLLAGDVHLGELGECRVVIELGGAAEIVRHPDPEISGPLAPDYLTAAQAETLAGLLHAEARRRGLLTAGGELPERLELGPILALGNEAERLEGLSAAMASGSDGVVSLDLVRDGPHAIVGGTTGSGKSEFLISWVLAMAAAVPPERLSVLLVDFKGGSTFGGLVELPHCVGVITDLARQTALRALESLRAEIAYRERHLAASGARSIEELREGSLIPRLVLVVDEFAAMVAEFPELHVLFADIASRGRSLGLHLILCTQRPAGVIRDAVLANSGLRLSLRVNNAADSVAVVGTDLASRLPAHPAGRAALSVAGESPRLIQVAIATAADLDVVHGRWTRPAIPVRRPWCEPLPPLLSRDELLAVGGRAHGNGDSRAERPRGIPFGLQDLPSEQRQVVARFDPENQGHLLVLGGQRSGKSTVLDIIADGVSRVTRVGADAERLWDVVSEWTDALRRTDSAVGSQPDSARYLLIDDLDASLAQLGDDHRAALLELLVRIAREGAARGRHLVLSAQRLGGSLQSLAQLLEARLLLRLPNKQDHLMAGGDGESFDALAPAGRGSWLGGTVQVAVSSAGLRPVPEASRVREIRLDDAGSFAVVTGNPGRWAARAVGFGGADPLGASEPGDLPHVTLLSEMPVADPEQLMFGRGGRSTIVVGDAESWQSNWAALGAVRGRIPLLFDGCSLADFRAIARRRELPPPLQTAGSCWLLSPDGTVERATIAQTAKPT